MALHVFVFLLVVCLLLALALLWRLDWFPLRPSSSRGGVKRTTLHRLLQPRSPDDCPACRLSYTLSSRVEPAPAPVRPWREVKSRRRAPKRVNTQGFACPNLQCSYFGITDAHIHALVGDGKHGRAEQIQTFRCHACRTTFTSRRNTPLYLYWLLGSSVPKKPFETEKDYLPLLANRGRLVYNPKSSPASSCSNDDTLR